MATLTVESSTADGRLLRTSTNYATARGGSSAGSVSVGSGAAQIGQQLNAGSYTCYETFLDFDTSAIPDAATITAVTLRLYGSADSSTTDFTIEAREYDWGATLETGDWIGGANLGDYTLLGSLSTVGFSTSGYNTFAEESTNFQTAINKTGVTRIVLCSSRHRVGNTPSGTEFVTIVTADGSSGQRPELEVTYTVTSGYSFAQVMG